MALLTQPQIIVAAIEYIILGGVIGGTALAVPVLVVGTGGVFVSATVYHAFIAAKRMIIPPSAPCCNKATQPL